MSHGLISLAALLDGATFSAAKSPLVPLASILELIAVGGWPSTQGISANSALRNHQSYLQDLVEYDFQTLDGPSDSSIAKQVLRSLARNVGQKTPISTIAKDVPGANNAPLRHPTAQAYVSKFQQLMVIEEVPAWVPHLRSRHTVLTSPIRHFVDPSLALAALSGTPAKLLKDLKTAGFLFENMLIRDLLVYSDAIGAKVTHYRDETGLEVDAVVEAFDGSWGAIEIKMGFHAVDEAAENLLKFKARVDTSVVGEPTFLAVLTNSEYSYTRPDGVHVISITALGA